MRLAVYYDLAFGGAANALALFVEHLRRSHTVDVFHPPGAWPIVPGTIPLPGVAPPGPSRIGYASRLFLPRYLRRLERAERAVARRLREYDRTLVHSCRHRGAPALLSTLGDGAVFYVTEPLRLYREPRPPEGEPPWIWYPARFLYTPVSRRFNQSDQEHGAAARTVLANSKYTAGRVRAIYKHEATVVYPPVNPVFLEAECGRGTGDYILSPGALIPQKGHGRVIRAVARMGAPRPRLILAGTPVNRRHLKRLVALAARRGVLMEVRENLSQADYLDCLRSARVVAVGAVMEPLGLVSLETQALGRPVVAVNEGGLPETVRDTRYVVDPDPEPFAEGLRAAMEEKDFDGRGARAWVAEHFSAARCGAGLEEALCA